MRKGKQSTGHTVAMATMSKPLEVFDLHSSLDIKEHDKTVVPNELALKITSRNSAPFPTLVNQSVSLTTFISVGRFISSQGKKGSSLEFQAILIGECG